MRKALLAAVAPLALLSSPAMAAVILPDTGWQPDKLLFANAPTVLSPLSFTISTKSFFRLTDASAPGDTYRLFSAGQLLATSLFGAKTSLDASSFDAFWTSAAFSKIDLLLDPGAYNLIVLGDGAGGIPSDLAVRVDAIPEPGTWALLLAGFGLIGGVSRRYSKRRVPKVSA